MALSISTIKCVYLLKTDTDIYKIGQTKNFTKRIKQYTPGTIILCVHPTNDHIDMETRIMKKFNELFIRRLDLGLEYYQNNSDADVIDKFQKLCGKIIINDIEFIGTEYLQSKYKNIETKEFNAKWSSVYKDQIKSWTFNREPCDDRVTDLVTQFNNSKFIDFRIILAIENSGLVCIDGNHRRLALDRLYQNNPELEIWVNILFINTSDVKVIHSVFKSINNILPVPEICLDKITNRVRNDIVNSIVKEYVTKYKIFFTNAINPRLPHTNITKFTNFISMNLGDSTRDEMIERLTIHNNKLGEDCVYPKCKKYNFYLFMRSQEYILN